MRVAYIVGSFPSLSETFILREIRALGERGLEVHVFALERGSAERVHADAVELAARTAYPTAVACAIGALTCGPARLTRAIRRLPVLARLPEVGFRRAARRLAAACAFYRAARVAGVGRVHAHFAFAPADVGHFLALLLDVRYSVSVHARDIHTQPPASLRARLRPAAFVSTCTRDGHRAVLAKCPELPPERLHLIRHGLPLDRWSSKKCDSTPCKVWNGRDTRLLAVGRLEPKKGFAHLVEACRILRDAGTSFGCVIAGEGVEQGPLETRIAESGLSECVELIGAVSQAECRGLFSQATVFVLPAVTMPNGDRDGVPNVLLEASACGIPVVSTPTGGIPELIDDGRTGLLVPPADPQALSDAIASLARDDELRERLGLAGRERVEREYDITRNVEELAELLRRGWPET